MQIDYDDDDFEFDGDEEVTPIGRKKAADDADDGFDIEIVDDTPEEDQGRKPLEADEDHEEEIESYSKRVQKRLDKLTHRVNDERREKERLAREHAEALRLAQLIVDENEHLKRTLNWGQQEYTREATGRLDYAQKIAQDKYRKAFESGDTDGVLEAQDELNALVLERHKLANMQVQTSAPRPPAQNTLQRANSEVYSNTNTAQPTQPRDYKAEEWASRNPWFGKDEEMTAFAYGLHEKLVKSGVDPTSDEYYDKVDSRLREVFPQNFKRSKKTSTVASAGRTSAGKRTVTLTKSQIAIAQRLGITKEQYAKHVAKLEQRNG